MSETVRDNLFALLTGLKLAGAPVDTGLWFEDLRHQLLDEGASDMGAARSILEVKKDILKWRQS